MKRLFFFIPIVVLVFATTLTKNSTKKLDREIFQLKENIRILEDRYEFTLLDYSILTSPKKLIEYQQYYFENKFIQKKIENLNLGKQEIYHLYVICLLFDPIFQ